MGTAAILALLLQNAPALLTEAPQIIAWLGSTYTRIMAVIDTPADQITEAQLLAALDAIKAEDQVIEKIT